MNSCFTESVMKIAFNILLSMNMFLHFSFLRVNICRYLLGTLVEDPIYHYILCIFEIYLFLVVLGLHCSAQAFL